MSGDRYSRIEADMFDAAIFSGSQDLHSTPATPLAGNVEPRALPAGFDARVYCDSVLLQSVLNTQLAQAGASMLSARLPYSAESFPTAVQNAVAANTESADGALGADIEIELRLTSPRLTVSSAVRSSYDSIAIADTISNATDATSTFFHGPALQLTWNVELNILRRSRSSDAIPAVSTREFADVRGVRREVRAAVAHGAAVTTMPTRIGAYPERLQLWLEMDPAHAAAAITSDDATLASLLESALGKKLVGSALDALTSQPSLRISPLFAIRGGAAQPSTLGLGPTAMRVAHSVRTLSNGNQTLAFAVDLGALR
jgi:hypothetical protein